VRYIKINVVGLVSDKKQMYDIETAAKLFLVAERMNDITYDKKENINDLQGKKSKKIGHNKIRVNNALPIFYVKGFN